MPTLRELIEQTWPNDDEQTRERKLRELATNVWNEDCDDVVTLPDGRKVLRKFLRDHSSRPPIPLKIPRARLRLPLVR
jgi:hypothetical protein